MDIAFFQRVQTSLSEKRQNLVGWLRSTPAAKKETELGMVAETIVQPHLHILNDALEKASEKSLGLCKVCHQYVDQRLLEVDYTAEICLDHYTAPERRQLEAELEFLQVIQRALLPQQPPAIPGLDIAAFTRPAQIASGDYFDFFQFPGGTHGIAIADAMGHGVSAGLLMGCLQSALRALTPISETPVEVLQRINRLFLHNINFTTFFTAVLCSYDPSSHTLTYSNAGHNPPLLFRQSSGDVQWLKPTGAAIGLIEKYDLQEKSLTLFPGDVLLFYTDGVTEARSASGEDFEKDRLAQTVQYTAALPAQDMLAAARQNLYEFMNGLPLDDDVTLVVCKVNQ
jgi:sigma-B regulation protein RsbU (phosphoserine phosphatase)